jgi:alkylation response protein AidB-like acyl-CoA dehydrogenase
MSADFSEFHEELRVVAREVLAEARPPAAGESPPSLDLPTLAASGWMGLEVPQALDGTGVTFAEVAVVLHEMGRSPLLCPYLGSAVLGVGALNLVEPSRARDDLLRQIAAGRFRVAVAVPTGEDAAAPFAPPFNLEASADRFWLTGRASFVPDAVDAHRLLLLARDPRSIPVIVEVDPKTPNLTVVEQAVLDTTRRFGEVGADRVEVGEDSVWRFSGDPEASARSLLDRGALAIACDSLGLAEAMVEATVAYAGVREQFGRPIGSFQAVKHACADMFVQVVVSRELIAGAVQRVSRDDVGAGRAVAMAKSHVCGAAVDIVGKAMQLHGGIGYTWESGVHVYLKRAVLNRSLFGSPTAHRRRLGERYLEGASLSHGD